MVIFFRDDFVLEYCTGTISPHIANDLDSVQGSGTISPHIVYDLAPVQDT